MVFVFDFKNVNKAYPNILYKLKNEGEIVSPRGLKTLEFSEPCITILKNPEENILTTIGRGGNIFFYIAEMLSILGGIPEREMIEYYNKNFSKYLDSPTDSYWHGFYGERIRHWGSYKGKKYYKNLPVIDQLEKVYERLSKNLDSRQAIINLFNPHLDLEEGHNDIPCNTQLMFQNRKGKLNLYIINRSNDINWGAYAVNLTWQFPTILKIMAGWLRLEVGKLYSFTKSLHLYLDNPITDGVLKYINSRVFDVYDYCKPLDCKMEKGEFDLVLKQIIYEEKCLRFGGERKLFLKNNWWNDIVTMLEVWSLRKNDKYLESLEKTFRLESYDMKISALEFQFRNSSKNPEMRDIIKKWVDFNQLDYMNRIYIYGGIDYE